MKLKYFALIFFLLLLALPAFAVDKPSTDIQKLNSLLDGLEIAYTHKDYALFESLFAKRCTVTVYDANENQLYQFNRDEWMTKTDLTMGRKDTFEESLTNRAFDVGENIASGKADFSFKGSGSYNASISGVDYFTFAKIKNEWKITSISYYYRDSGLTTQPTNEYNNPTSNDTINNDIN